MSQAEISRVKWYSPEVAEAIGGLGPDLSASLSGEPMDEFNLREIVASPYHDQLIATVEDQIVGAATVSLMFGGPSNARKAWLEDFVVSEAPEVRGQGVGFTLFWDGVIGWSRQRQAKQLLFTSHHSREAAHKFYFRQGCEVPETTLFRHDLIDLS